MIESPKKRKRKKKALELLSYIFNSYMGSTVSASATVGITEVIF